MSGQFAYVDPRSISGAATGAGSEGHGAALVELTASETLNLSAYATSTVYDPNPSFLVSPSTLLYKSVLKATADTSMDVLLQGLTEFSDPTGTIDVYVNEANVNSLFQKSSITGKWEMNVMALTTGVQKFANGWIQNASGTPVFTDAQGFVGLSAPATVSDDHVPPHAVPTLGQAIMNLGDQTLFLGSATNALAYGIPYGNSNDVVQTFGNIPVSSPLVSQLISDASEADKWNRTTDQLALAPGDDLAFIVEVATTQRVQYSLSGVDTLPVADGTIEYYVAGQQYTIDIAQTNPADLSDATKTRVYYKVHFVAQ
jgi:hypothetical protein